MTATDRAYKNARRFRRQLTPPELLLWARLRRGPVRIRRQHPIGPYVLDFYFAAGKLAIEVDGQVHGIGDQPERDRQRETWLKDNGIDVVRIAASEVLADPDSAAQSIVAACLDRGKPLHHSAALSGPPPHGYAAGRST
ncbi:MAG TPA: endonuclease domain-containing protein [Sphingomicrobium sp.]